MFAATSRLAQPQYRALLDPKMVQIWRVPDGMTSEIHVFQAYEGGEIRISLTYAEGVRSGKTKARTDTYHGYFAKLVLNKQVVEVEEFETSDPNLRGEMTCTIMLTEIDGETTVEAAHDNLPPGLAPDDNEVGWRMALDKLTRLVETPSG